MQRTSLRFARSPLTLRLGTAARRSPRLWQATASTAHPSSRRITAPRLYVEGSRLSRSQPACRPSSLLRQRTYRVFLEHNHVPQTTLTARPPWLAVPPYRRCQHIPFFGASWVHSPQAQLRPLRHIESRREARDVGRRSTSGCRLNIALSEHRPSRPRAFPRASAVPVLFSPPRIHSAVPNPGVQWTRFARH